MSNIKNRLKRQKAMRWPEILAGSYLLLFFLVAFAGPSSGLLQLPNAISLDQVYQPPITQSHFTREIHYLGTDQLGRDVLANLIYGARTALLVSLPAMILATIIGLVLGSVAGFWGDTGLRPRVVSVLLFLIILIWSIYYCFYIRQVVWQNVFTNEPEQVLQQLALSSGLFILLGLVAWLLSGWLYNLGVKNYLTLPADQVVLKIIEILGAVPRLLLIMCLTAFTEPALPNIILLCAFTYWTGIARLIRGELLQIKTLPYIEAARIAGLNDWQILVRQALPNCLSPVIVAFAFGLGNLMSLEATLSFLGIGIPPEVPSWGRMINGIRSNETAWWLLVFPTVTLCCTILSIQVIARYFIRIINPLNN